MYDVVVKSSSSLSHPDEFLCILSSSKLLFEPNEYEFSLGGINS